MPIYTYICKSCGEKFDLLVGVGSEKSEPRCKKCGSEDIQKQFATFGVNTSSGNKLDSSKGPSCPAGNCSTCFLKDR